MTTKAKRRRFSAAEKLRILQEADACERGELGALLRREGLYSSHLVEWRRAREAGELAGLTPRKRGPKAQATDPLAEKLAAVEREVARLKAENAKLQLICDVQKKSLAALGSNATDGAGRRREQRELVMSAVTFLAPQVGIFAACVMLAVARASYYRSLVERMSKPRPSPPRALSAEERQDVLDVLHEPRFVDLAPAEVFATLLDENRYLCSERTMYRILAANNECASGAISSAT